MSMHYWNVTGYGINEEELCPSTDKQIAFIKKYLPADYEEMQENGEDNCDMSNTAEYMDYCRNWIEDFENDNGDTGFGALLAKGIQENEEGFYPGYFYNDGYGAIMYEDRLPWEMTDRVKNMTAEDMEAIFKKYLNELGVSATVERQSVEFWG